MSKIKTSAESVLPWLRLNGFNLGALTGQDVLALQAAVSVVALWNKSDEAEDENPTLIAFRICVERMQASTRRFAYHAIAMIGDWDTRAKVWTLAGLPLENFGRCANE